MSMTFLRRAAEADVPQVRSLLQRSWLSAIAPHLTPEARARFAEEDPANGYSQAMWEDFMLSEAGGAVVGMCHVHGDLIAAIHVDPDLKRRGIGTQLMGWAEAELARHHRGARLEVLACNTPAQAFYAARGWRVSGRSMGEELGAPVEILEMRLDLGTASAVDGEKKQRSAA